MKPGELSTTQLDAMVRAATFAWVADWFNAYLVKDHPSKESLRIKWMNDDNAWAARAGWNLTASRIAQSAKETKPAKGAKPPKTAKPARRAAKGESPPAPATIQPDAAPTTLDLAGLLDRIERELPGARPETQWTMNAALANIGIHDPTLRPRAIAIGEKLGIYRDYPCSKGCTSPFAPIWIAEMVKRQG
jgi:3-methyladenine DNA glycosylase AlkD